jgi:hypothetical protein
VSCIRADAGTCIFKRETYGHYTGGPGTCMTTNGGIDSYLTRPQSIVSY